MPESFDQRVRFPLWLKLGVVFGTAVALGLGATLWFDTMDELREAQAERKKHQVGLASSVALTLDGDVLRTFRRGADMARPDYQALYQRLRATRHAADVRWLGIYGRKGKRYFFVVDGEDEDPLPLNYPVFDISPGMLAAFDGHEGGYDLDNQDEWGRWDTAYAPVEDGAGEVAAVLAVDVDADWKDTVRRKRIQQAGLTIGIATLLVLVAASVFARYLGRHLGQLASAANAMAGGDLDGVIEVRSQDEVGVLARAFDGMRVGLKERDFIRAAFGRYVNEEVAQKILADPDALKPGGELRTVTILMSDLRGFTSLSERLSPAEMVGLLNAYLGRMAEVVAEHGGTVNEFIGDAVLALFGAPTPCEDHALHAVACAAAMQLELVKFTAEHPELPPLHMGIGLNTGPVIVGNIGSDAHMKYGVVGDAVNLAARVESFTVGGEVLLSEDTRGVVGDAVEVRGPIEVRAKGKKEPLRLFALLAVGEPWGYLVPVPDLGNALTDVTVPADCFRLDGKTVAETPVPATLVQLGQDDADLVCGEAFAVFDNLVLTLRPDGGAPLEQIYAKVTATSPEDGAFRLRLRFTSVPEPKRLEALRAPA